MKNLKKMLAVLAVMTVAAAPLTACGGSAEQSESSVASTVAVDKAEEEVEEEVVEEEEEEEEEELEEDEYEEEEEEEDEDEADEIDADIQAYIDALANTAWAGMDTDHTVYVLAFGDEKVYFAADDGSELEGYWGINTTTAQLLLFSDADLTDQIGEIDWTYDEENDVMVINENVVMAQTEADDLTDVTIQLENMKLAAAVADALDGTYWYGNDEENAALIELDGEYFTIALTNEDGTQGIQSFYWNLTADTLTLYNADYEVAYEFGWDVTEDLTTFYLTSEDGETDELTQITEEEAEAVYAELSDYAASVQ